MGIDGNERADEMAKMGAAKEGRDHVTGGGTMSQREVCDNGKKRGEERIE